MPSESEPTSTDGVSSVTVDVDRGRVIVEYDPDHRSAGDAERMARQLAAAVTEPDARCTLHVSGEGGRSCESCALALERHLRETTGVRDADVSFRNGLLRLVYDTDLTSERELERAVREFGIEIREDPIADGEFERATFRRETAFVGVTFVGMVGGLIGSWVDAPAALVWLCYGGAYLFGGWYGVGNAVESLRYRTVDIDLLMILAALGALVVGAPFEGAMLLFLFSLSNVLQQYAIGRSRDAIRALVKMRPESAQLLRGGEEVTVAIEDVDVGDVFVVRPGDRIPLDGVVLSGESTVDQASLTGESVPVTKSPGDEVFGGTINENGSLEVEVTRHASESAIARLIHMVEDAQSRKAPTQRLIDRLEQPYVLGVFGLTIAAIGIPMLLGAAFDSTFYRAMTLMVAASPCAVIISTPAAVLSAITAGARQGVLFKGGEYVETAATIDAVAFDKTGTLTEGNTELSDVSVHPDATIEGEQLTTEQLLAWTAAVQSRSEHHLAEATVRAARERSLDVPDSEGFQATVGKGVRAIVDGRAVHVGNPRYFEAVEESVAGIETGLAALSELQDEGKTSVLVARESDDGLEVIGWLAFADTIRPGAAEMIEELRALGIEHVVMLTGDNERVAQRIGTAVGVDEVKAELLPAQKVESVEELRARYGAVAMVGDGVNDAPALATATLGIGMGGAGTDVALETADVVLMSDELDKIPYALGLGRATRHKLVTNFAIAFGAIALMIGAILTRGIPLPLAVVGHEGSTVLVSLNGLRLLGFRN